MMEQNATIFCRCCCFFSCFCSPLPYLLLNRSKFGLIQLSCPLVDHQESKTNKNDDNEDYNGDAQMMMLLSIGSEY